MHQLTMNVPAAARGANPAPDRSELERIATASLEVGRLLMETGARAEIVHADCSLVAHGLGADHVDVRSGYASLDITIASGASTVTRMTEVGAHGLNYLLGHAIRNFARQICQGGLTAGEASDELTRLKKVTPHHAPWLVAFAVGIACASFGRLLGIDWPAFMPVAVAGAIDQTVRQQMMHRGVNVFVVAAAVAFLSSSLGELGAKWVGSTTVILAMIASVLLLVPGYPLSIRSPTSSKDIPRSALPAQFASLCS